MTDHVFGYIDGDEFIAIVNGKGVSYEVRRNHRATSPGFDDALLTAFVLDQYLFFELWVDKRSFFQRTCHGYSVVTDCWRKDVLRRVNPIAFSSPINNPGMEPLLAFLLAADDELAGSFLLVAGFVAFCRQALAVSWVTT